MLGFRVRVECHQVQPTVGSTSANLELIAKSLRESVGRGADLVVFPELATSGYTFRSKAEVALAAMSQGHACFEKWRSILAGSTALALVGFPERTEDGRLHNSAALVSSEGILTVYRKTHLWGEEGRWFQPGNAPAPIVDTASGRLGVLICYDLEFPEMTRDLGLRGADLVAVPTNWPRFEHPENERPAEIGNAMVMARLNRVFIACCDRTGSERGVDWTGGTCVIDPDGWVLAERSRRDLGLVAATVDLPRARDKAVGDANDVFADRRPELYRSLIAPADSSASARPSVSSDTNR